MQASRGPLVRVFRRPFTPRSHLVEGRFNALLKLEAQIPQNSYLFTWQPEEPKQTDLKPFINEMKKIVETGKLTPKHLELIRQRIERTPIKKIELKERKLPSYDETKYIPGSSIKGALRSRIEYKFAPKKVDEVYKSQACYIVQGNAQQGRHADFWGEDATYGRERLCSGEDGNVCVVCDLFGTPSLSSRVQTSDALLKSGRPETLPDGLEVFPPNSIFNLEVTTLNSNYAELGLLLLGFEIPSKSPILIGLRKYFYNPKVGQAYKGKYYFGLLRVNLTELVIFNSTMKRESIESKKAVEKCLDELKHEYDEWLDYERGIIKL